MLTNLEKFQEVQAKARLAKVEIQRFGGQIRIVTEHTEYLVDDLDEAERFIGRLIIVKQQPNCSL